MCGIAGCLGDHRPAAELAARARAQADTLRHRGPDDAGVWVEPGAGLALAHRRLAILDLSPAGRQPMVSHCGRYCLVFNGEIYNFRDLRAALDRQGQVPWRGHSDTEVLLAAVAAWGLEEALEAAVGMFALAFWDRERQVLTLARDRLGEKPLYYGRQRGVFLFGSELGALRAHPAFAAGLDRDALAMMLRYAYVPTPWSIYQGIHKLPPGHLLEVGPQGEQGPRPYWSLREVAGKGLADPLDLPPAEAAEELEGRLAATVEGQRVADVPLGAFLSGGVDSSAVVALMARQSEDPVHTCSISFGDPRFDESAFARQVAERYRTDHRVEEVDPNDFGLVDRLAELYDEPYADSSAMPTYRVCELARKQVTVALSGDGGDENLAGYRRYRWHMYEERARALLPLGVRRPLFGFLGRVYPKLDWAPRIFRGKSTFQALARDSVEGYYHNISILHDEMRARLYSEAFQRDLQGYRAIEVLRGHAAKAPTDHPLSLVQYLDFKSYLVGDILTKVDRASMAHALEVRVPILDHELVEWMARLPPDLKLHGSEGKYIFKRALEPLLPRDILYRPKMGFAVPLAAWFRGPLRERVRGALLGEGLTDTGLFDRAYLEHLVSAHQSGRRDYSAALWSLLMFEAWRRRVQGR